MEKNTDERIVVMDCEVYDRLLGLAGIGAWESGSGYNLESIKSHARRFNPHLAAAAAARRKAKAAEHQAQIVAVKELLKTHTGKTLWVHTDGYWVPVTVRGRDPRVKTGVRIYSEVECGSIGYGWQTVELHQLLKERPEGLEEIPLSQRHAGAWRVPVKPQPPALGGPDYGTVDDYLRWRKG